MKKKHVTRRAAVLAVVVAVAAMNAMPSVAAVDSAIQVATASNALKKATASNAEEKATSSNAKKKFSMDDMPKIGSKAFTKWFFANVEESELWDFVLSLMDDGESEDYEAFIAWVEEHEEEFLEVYQKYVGEYTAALSSSATGDLWDEWTGANMNWSGSGTKSDPYKITSISELMGLSEAVAQGESFKGKYFELQSDIELGDLNLNNGSWNPIGWYKNASSLSGTPTAFEGTFDGAGNTISGLKIHEDRS